MKNEIGRRQFHRLGLAAFGGVLAGAALSACSGKEGEPHDEHGDHAEGGHDDDSGSEGGAADTALLMSEPHVCRGLNTCKGNGAGGGNDCAGLGSCASADAHSCHGSNECKGQGGCGTTAGINSCKGTGECGVPLKDSAWEKARAGFEAAMKTAGKNFGDAPAKG